MTQLQFARCDHCKTVNRFDVERPGRPVCGKCKTLLDSRKATRDRPQSLNDATFSEQVLDASLPVLVDFFATWCGACRTLDPALEAAANRFRGRLRVFKLDVDKNPAHARHYDIRATPTLILFSDGQIGERITGAVPEAQLEVMLEKHTG